MYIIDTDVLSALAKRRRDQNVESWLIKQRALELFVSVVSIGEIERGIFLQRRKDPDHAVALERWLDQILSAYGDRILPFDLASARRWGQLSAEIGNSGADLQIAATALEHGLKVVSRNVSDFRPTGVNVISPFVTQRPRRS